MFIEDKYKKEIMTTCLFGKLSFVFILPRSVAKEYGIEESSQITVEGTNEGILIKKINYRHI